VDTIDSSDSKEVIKLNISTATVKAGKVFTLKVKNSKSSFKFTSGNTKKVKVTSSGKVAALCNGYSIITAKSGRTTLKCVVKVVTNPKLSKKALRVRKGKFRTVRITGKAKTFRNTYAKNRYARISAKRTSTKFRVVGKRRGLTVLRLRVNGYLLKLRVRVI
jgi:ferredoxin-NADP reductase